MHEVRVLKSSITLLVEKIGKENERRIWEIGQDRNEHMGML